MRIEFTNGATVHQFWKDLPDGDLLAVFQYFSHADEWAKQSISTLPARVSLVVVDHGTGKSRRYISTPTPEAE